MTSANTIITIAGNMGAGKTALVERLSSEMNWTPYYEQNEDNTFLADFYDDMERWGLHSQPFFLSRRMRIYKDMMRTEGTVLQDRGIFEDAEVFARNLFEQGHMSARDYELYQDLYQECIDLMPLPGFVVYLKASVPTLVDRIRSRGRQYEKTIDKRYLEQLNKLYEDWILRFTFCPSLTIPVDELDFVQNSADFESIKRVISNTLESWQQDRLEFRNHTHKV